MNTIEAIRTRRSVKSYKADMPPSEMIDTVLNAGIQAPSGRNSQSVILVAIKDKAIRDEYSRANASVLGADIDPFYGAPVIIVALVKRGVPCEAYDGPLALENMMLAAHELGLGSCWIHRAREMFETELGKEFKKEWGIADELVGIGHCVLGYRASDLANPKPRKEDFVRFIK